MKDAESLRNNLAHANDLGSENWPKIAETVEKVEALLRNLESDGPGNNTTGSSGGPQ